MKLVFKSRIPGDYKISDNLLEVMANNPDKEFRNILIDKRLQELDLSYIIKIINNTGKITCTNYEDILYINELANKGLVRKTNIHLEDDLEMKDRSYIDFSILKNITLTIPTSYYMWGVKNIDESKSNINQKSIDEITRILEMIKQFPEELTDIEKIIIISNYIQQYCEYINSKKDILNRTKEQFELIGDIDDDREVIKKLCHDNYNQVGFNINEPLFQNYATCTGFAILMELFLNNPYIKIRTEQVSGNSHTWNVVLLNNKYYNLDITRSITYSPYRAKNNLRTLQFNEKYLLCGTDFLESEGHEKRETKLDLPIEESKEDFNPDYIEAAIEHLRSTGLIQFEYSIESFYHRESSPLSI